MSEKTKDTLFQIGVVMVAMGVQMILYPFLPM